MGDVVTDHAIDGAGGAAEFDWGRGSVGVEERPEEPGPDLGGRFTPHHPDARRLLPLRREIEACQARDAKGKGKIERPSGAHPAPSERNR